MLPVPEDPPADLVDALVADLRAARFTVDGVERLWGMAAGDALERGDRVPARRAARAAGGPLGVLARFLILGDHVTRAELADALPTLALDGARRLGLADDADPVVPHLDIRPTSVIDDRGASEWWIVSDLGELATEGALPPGHVLGLGGASATLAGLLLPGPIGTALDLGTGCGIQTLHLSRDGAQVTATDLSARARALAALTLAVNGVDAELLVGDLFEPVAGRRFSRIVSNPPFVITPRDPDVPRYEYRDGGLVGDALVERVIRGCADHLEVGGIAQLLGNWESVGGRDGLERAADWARESGLDAWIVEREQLDPARYAETWIRDGGTRPGDAAYEPLVGAWLDDFDARGVTAIGFGYVLLRRPEGAPSLARAERVDAALDGASIGPHWAAALDAHDALVAVDDAQLLARHLRVASDVTEERSHLPGESDPRVITLRQGGGFRRERRVETALAAIVGACDGDLSLGALVHGVAILLDESEEALRARLLPELREMVVDGWLSMEISAAPQ